LPIIFTTTLLILIINFLGLIPYGFTVSSHIFFTFSLAFIHFLAIFIMGLYRQRFNFIKLFLPKNIDNIILFLFIFIIEIFSYCIRPFSLAIRLFANMLAGHTSLYILSKFCFLILAHPLGFSVLILFCFSVYILELGICLIQAYVFTILLILFLSDIYKLGH
jgi:ATP synthase subunit 6